MQQTALRAAADAERSSSEIMKIAIAVCLMLLSFALCTLAQDLFTINMSTHIVSDTNIAWRMVVTNHTDVSPAGGPYSDYIYRVFLNDIYSDSPPRLAADLGWGDMAVSEIYPDHYSVTLNSTDTNYYIGPGSAGARLIFFTTVPNTNCEHRTGNCLGRALTVNNSWLPEEPGQPFIGPIGIAPLSGIESISITGGACELSITNTSVVWQHTVERNTQMAAPELWSPCHTFSMDTNRYVWTGTPSNGTAFYRIKSEYK